MKVPFTAISHQPSTIWSDGKQGALVREKPGGIQTYTLGKTSPKWIWRTWNGPATWSLADPPVLPGQATGTTMDFRKIRAEVFMAVIKMILAFIKTGELKAVMENVEPKMNEMKGQDESFMDKILTWLCKEASEFDWQVVVLKAGSERSWSCCCDPCRLQILCSAKTSTQDYRLAQQRTRVFLRGMRTSCGSGHNLGQRR